MSAADIVPILDGPRVQERRKLTPWRTIHFGLPRVSVNEVLAGCFIEKDGAEFMLSRIQKISIAAEIDLVAVCGWELGLGKTKATYEAVCRAGRDIGLKLCAARMAIILRHEYSDQPRDEILHVMMPPMLGQILSLANLAGCLQMRSDPIAEIQNWYGFTRYIFELPRDRDIYLPASRLSSS